MVCPWGAGPCFPEFIPYLGLCRFTGCRHNSEPDCAVKQAVADGKLVAERYTRYLELLAELRNRRKRGGKREFAQGPSQVGLLFCQRTSCLAKEVQEVEAGGADWLHLDVMDGAFVPNITFGVPVVAAVRAHTRLPLDVHLMIERPELYVADFCRAGADLITVHVETAPHLHRLVTQIKGAGAAVGVALNPATPLSTVAEILPDIDLLLIMTVNPGFGGQSFIPSGLDKLRRAAELLARKAPGSCWKSMAGSRKTMLAKLCKRARRY